MENDANPFNPWKPEINLNNFKFSPYLTGNTLRLRYKAQPVNAVYCENNKEHIDIYKFSSYLRGNTLRLRYKAKPVNAV
jgi:hypothetical protein